MYIDEICTASGADFRAHTVNELGSQVKSVAYFVAPNNCSVPQNDVLGKYLRIFVVTASPEK